MASARLFGLVACLVLGTQSAHAAVSCKYAVEPRTSGFRLNPVLTRVVVRSATAKAPGDTCPLQAEDEILQVNSQKIPGQRALAVMKYWKSLKKGAPVVFKIRRSDSIQTFTVN